VKGPSDLRPRAALRAGRLGPALAVLCALALPAGAAYAQQQIDYRPLNGAPTEEDIGGGYVTPAVQRPLPRAQWREVADVGLLAAALAAGGWMVLKRRSRKWLVGLTIGCLAYFGFYREGCVCPIGAIQNVTVALLDPRYAVSYVVIALFLLPLVAAVLFGRVFCGGVCALGAIQDLVLVRPLRVPRLLDKLLGTLKWVYLGLAIWLAAQPVVAAGAAAWWQRRDFIICRFDPFVGFFRLTGPTHMLLIGGGLLVLGMFVGRPYCRYLCPYGALLSLLSRIAWRGVTITPDKELDCGLCAEACPFGAIEKLRAVRSSCLFCARCFDYCPRERVRPIRGPTAPPKRASATDTAEST